MRLKYFAAFLLWATDPALAQTKFNRILGSGRSPRQMPRPNTTRTAANSKWPFPVRLLDTTHTEEIASSPLRILLRVTTHTLGNGNWPLLAHHQFVVITGAVVSARGLALGTHNRSSRRSCVKN